MHIRNGKMVNIHRPKIDDILYEGTIYPAPVNPHWFPLLGISEVPDPPRPDERLYEVTGRDDAGQWVVSARPLAEVKADRRRLIRSEFMRQIDKKYDWPECVIRLAAGVANGSGNALFTALAQDLNQLKNAYQTAIDAVNACTTVEQVVAVNASWPTL